MEGTTGQENLWPFLVYSLLVVATLAGTLLLGWLGGTRTPRRRATVEPFESGIVPVGSAGELRFSIEFYLVAMFFVIFDLETIFIFAWAVAFWDLGWRGYIGIAIFIAILLAVLVYEVRTGTLDWGAKGRGPIRRARYADLGSGAGRTDVAAGPETGMTGVERAAP